MKKTFKKPRIEKFKIAELKNPGLFVGGNGDDDGTVEKPDEPQCRAKSKIKF